MSEQDLDRRLVERVQEGDRKAFDLLVLKYQQRILNLIGRYVRDFGDAQDVAQETFIKAYRALPRFRNESAFYTWLYRIAINTAKNHLAALSRRPPGHSDLEASEAEQFSADSGLHEQGGPERLIARDQLKDVIFETIEKLPEDLRTALTLRELEGFSYEQIAEVMGCPVGTVRSRIFRAREAVEKRIGPML
ncbi:RNA polymerase sigma factor RpoE [Pelagibaculum spongiae]|uniref:RNA polymerase sigma factor n=1 Tax=Pelagibaculum spongiae TaxID=2080658 RepID=A0A2V1GPY0_9GAMM|nr:RNA polymerase sigma factor RpoE [Pelagibaculum spongiae]PVZ64941.1 RNA polymerase sigma factor RpoE [Pelagibaculum spongiae]